MTPSQINRANHKEKFRKIGAAISAMKVDLDRDYTTGEESRFHFVVAAADDPKLSSHYFGPQYRTWQLERTTRKDD